MKLIDGLANPPSSQHILISQVQKYDTHFIKFTLQMANVKSRYPLT